MSANKAPNIKEQIIQVLSEHGSRDTAGMLEFIKNVQKDSVHSKALELMHDGFLTRDGNMMWSLAEGVTPQSYAAGEPEDEEGSEQSQGSGKGSKTAGAGAAAGVPLDARQMFETLLKSVAVKPPEVIPTISNIFFGGDIDNLKWLEQVLRRHAAGWVAPNQIRLILSSWSNTRGLPYDEKEFAIEPLDGSKGGKSEAKETVKTGTAKVLEDAGIGWKVAKDKDGDWVAMPGGTMTQEEATAGAERRATIAAMGMGNVETTSDESSQAGEGRPASKAAKPGISFQDKLMDKVLDAFIEGKTGKGSEDSEVVKRLEAEIKRSNDQIRDMKDQQDRDWRERIEANMAAIASNDPWSDPVQVARIRQAIGYQPSAVTDSSPAVQLIKDSTEKVDKNVNRLTGIIERMVLQGDVFRPEETRTPEEKERKANAILTEASSRQHSTQLRKRVFNV